CGSCTGRLCGGRSSTAAGRGPMCSSASPSSGCTAGPRARCRRPCSWRAWSPVRPSSSRTFPS
ncbi:MAG: hypothetical protein AVDCRST_MAG50-100, partial [uncultured Acidimicrobiales bacterium]